MTNLSSDDVRHIAKLARLNLKEEELDKFSTELSAILGYINQLSEVDTSNVEVAGQATGITNAFREDVVTNEDLDRDALLACSPLPIVDHQIQTPSAHG